MAKAMGDHVPWIVEEAYERPLPRSLLLLVKPNFGQTRTSFAYSLSQAKRGWCSLSLEAEAKFLKKHKERMAAPSKELGEEQKFYLSWAARLVFDTPFAYDPTGTGPSVRGHTMECERGPLSDPGNETDHVMVKSWTRDSDGALGYCKAEHGYDPLMGSDPTSAKLNELQSNVSAARWELNRSLRWEAKLTQARDQARVIVVTEPAKFRPVTAGSPLLYTSFLPIQAYMLQAWKSSPFSTMEDEDLTGRVGELLKFHSTLFGDRVPLLNSADYEAATDNMLGTVTRHLMRWFCENKPVPADVVETLDRTISDCLLYYPDYDLKNKKSGKASWAAVLQTNGQLMGHPLSFPLLCVANLATVLANRFPYCYSPNRVGADYDQGLNAFWERFHLEANKKDLSGLCLVNGDDLLYPMVNQAEFDRWAVFARSLGLIPSFGKCFLSLVKAMINSQLFQIGADGSVKRLGYLNQKLVLNVCLKQQGGSDQSQVGRDLSLMFKLCPKTVCSLSDAMRNRKSLLPGMSWFVPPHRGGCGIDPVYSNKPVKLTVRQRCLASASFRDPFLSLLCGRESVARLSENCLSLGWVREPRRLAAGELYSFSREAFWKKWFAWTTGVCSDLFWDGSSTNDVIEEERARKRRWSRALKGCHPIKNESLAWLDPELLDYPIVPPIGKLPYW